MSNDWIDVEVLFKAESVTVALNGEVLTRIGESIEHCFHMADVEGWIGDCEPDFGCGSFSAADPSIRFEENCRRHLSMESRLSDCIDGFVVKPQRV